MVRGMKRGAVVFHVFVLVITAVSGVLGMLAIRGAYGNEIRTVQNLAGKVIVAYPETEGAFLEALGDMDRKDAAAGADILAHYGYDEEERIKENTSYRHAVRFLLCVLAVFCVLSFLGMYLAYRIGAGWKKRQEEQILSILESCLSEDYRFLATEEALHALDNPLFADTLAKLGKSLKLKTERLAEEHDNTKTLVTDISHQLRTPISALKVCFPLYLEAEEEAEKEEFLARCRLQFDKLEMLAAALVNISHLETHIIRLQSARELLSEVLTESVNTVYHKARKKQISIENVSEKQDEAEGIELFLDKKWTVEAVANVLDNAIKYSPTGSSIRMRVQKSYSFVRVEIEDDGIGIPGKERNQTFRRFYRGSNDIVKKEEGAGVGLYLSRKILEDEGGAIFVRPAGEKGSIFVIQLPLPA